jgi:asparagine synthase (glutamine-hydrolysing)
MCAISAIIYQNTYDQITSDIEMMNNMAIHRGPDGEGYHFGQNFALGHRRLAITDLSEEGKQPMTIEGYTITFNGEIYNFQRIKQELTLLGVTFLRESDTEVLLQAYITWGQDCVEKLDGMWSFIIFDPKKHILFCSRDKVGMKPFYYSHGAQVFFIASEIKQILPFVKNKTANKEAIVDYLVFGLEDHLPETFFKNIFRLNPGHNLIFDLSSHTYKIFQYSSLQALPESTEMDPIDKVKTLLSNAVKLRQTTQVKIGTMVSGGLDSAIISACLTHHSDSYAIHARSTDPVQDESNYAKEVANHLGLDLHIVSPSISDWSKEIDQIIKVQEEPFGSLSVIMQHKLFEQAKRDGVKVLLDGQGADELFLGYRPYFYKSLNKYNVFQKLKIYYTSKSFISHNLIKSIVYYAFINSKALINLYIHRHKKLITPILYKLIMPKKLYKKYGLGQNMGQWQISEINQYQLPPLLRYEDKNAMSQGIETRLPFLDHAVVQLAISLPEELKINRGITKFSLRKAFEKRLPSTIVWRKDKIGFAAPNNLWFDQNLDTIHKELAQSSFLKLIVNKNINFQKTPQTLKWRLYCLSRWSQIFNVEDVPIFKTS